ncbi:MAG: hypothetical protein LBQ90_09080, partial [Synergistaceae bacterium]|nr:hypothetical protein [Synergistaceae bacterium]
MKKTEWAKGVLCLGILCPVIAAAFLPPAAEALKTPVLLEVSGIFKALDTTANVVVLEVNGQDASAPLFYACRFLNERGEEIEGKAFAQRYLRRPVTLELF